MDGGAWWAAVHGVAESQTWLSDFTFTFHFHAFEKEMATHSSVLAWRIPGMGEPGRLPSMGSHRVRHEWSDLAAAGGGSVLKNPLINILDTGDAGSIPGLGRSLQKEMTAHSSIIAPKILWTEEPVRLQSMGSQRFGHNLANVSEVRTQDNQTCTEIVNRTVNISVTFWNTSSSLYLLWWLAHRTHIVNIYWVFFNEPMKTSFGNSAILQMILLGL